jgi:hypothetical protein
MIGRPSWENETRLRRHRRRASQNESSKCSRRIRMSRTVAITGTLLVVTAVLILVASLRQNGKTSAKDVHPRAHPSQPSQREREAQRYRLAVLVPTSCHGGNGRNSESIGGALSGRARDFRS